MTNKPKELCVVYRDIDSLLPYSNNARTHSREQLKLIAKSIEAFGFSNPILIDRQSRIVAGHGRAQAAKQLGLRRVPTIALEDLTDEQIRLYAIADNRLAEKAGWDRSILRIEFQHLVNLDGPFDITLAGFELPEIDLILEEDTSSPSDAADEVAIPSETNPITRVGDLWLLGRHRFLCGSSLERTSFDILMGDKRADIVFVDPPYNVPIDGHASGNGAVRHREFAMASGEMNEEEFVAFLSMVFRHLSKYSRYGSVHFVCMDWRHLAELLGAAKQVYNALLNLCIWVKNNGGMGSFYRSRHELVFVFRNGKGKHRNNIQLGQFGRNRSNVWEYPGIASVSRTGEEGNLLVLHPTIKPVQLIADALLDCSARGEIVLDSFLGSGSTLIAAERVGRVCYGLEIDPLYVDVAIRRWQQYTGERAIHDMRCASPTCSRALRTRRSRSDESMPR
jgi:DNA modification methylase